MPVVKEIVEYSEDERPSPQPGFCVWSWFFAFNLSSQMTRSEVEKVVKKKSFKKVLKKNLKKTTHQARYCDMFS